MLTIVIIEPPGRFLSSSLAFLNEGTSLPAPAPREPQYDIHAHAHHLKRPRIDEEKLPRPATRTRTPDTYTRTHTHTHTQIQRQESTSQTRHFARPVRLQPAGQEASFGRPMRHRTTKLELSGLRSVTALGPRSDRLLLPEGRLSIRSNAPHSSSGIRLAFLLPSKAGRIFVRSGTVKHVEVPAGRNTSYLSPSVVARPLSSAHARRLSLVLGL
jgi:hypothetical protein